MSTVKKLKAALFLRIIICSVFPLVPSYAAIAPFSMEGTISTKAFWPGQINPHYSTDANFVFQYSGDSWQVELTYINPDASSPSVENCMQIPGGIREYTLFKGNTNGMTAAHVCPTAYPPPGKMQMFASWLSLCPRPELPLIGKGKMHRFLNVPNCRVELFNHQQNEGSIFLKYLNAEQDFLSELSITNNGVIIFIGSENNAEIKNLSPPFDHGYLESKYQVLQTTNYRGATFPLETEYRCFGANPQAKSNDELYTAILTRLSIKKIQDLKDSQPHQAVTQLFAIDGRPANLPSNSAVGYVVENDRWRPASDPDIVWRANALRRPEDAKKMPTKTYNMGLIFLAIVLVPPVLFFAVRLTKKRQH